MQLCARCERVCNYPPRQREQTDEQIFRALTPEEELGLTKKELEDLQGAQKVLYGATKKGNPVKPFTGLPSTVWS